MLLFWQFIFQAISGVKLLFWKCIISTGFP
jgi:hypothetical protein